MEHRPEVRIKKSYGAYQLYVVYRSLDFNILPPFLSKVDAQRRKKALTKIIDHIISDILKQERNRINKEIKELFANRKGLKQ